MSEPITTTYLKNKTATDQERNHIILLDGTWNDETGVNLDGLVTNIVRLQRIFENDEQHQIVRYHRGVGNDNDNGWIANKLKGATGRGVDKIVDHAYARFVQDWQKGDQIFIFGFSRGSAAARLLANKICLKGIPDSITITLKAKENKATKVVEQVITACPVVQGDTPYPIDISFLGVWDTVSAFGLWNNFNRFIGRSRDDLFTDCHIAPNIKRAVHLVAMDETRNPFVPSLMNEKAGITHEVWFPGVHSDIGGSYAEDELARATLHYMLKMTTEWVQSERLKPLHISEGNYQAYTLATTCKAHFHFHGNAIGEDLRPIGVQVNGAIDPDREPQIHQLYHDLCESPDTYSVVTVKNGEGKKEVKHIQFQYRPFNVKRLRGRYKIVS